MKQSHQVQVPHDIAERVNAAVEATRAQVGAEKGDLINLAQVWVPGGKSALLGVPWRNDEEKFHAIEVLRRACRGAELLIFRVEAHMAAVRGEAELQAHIASGKRVSELKSSVEVMTFTVETPLVSLFGSLEIIREGEKRRLADGPIEWRSGANGVLSNILYRPVGV